jgi:hypothetical protein
MSTLDFLEQWTLPPNLEQQFSNDLSARRVLWFGLEHLYDTVASCERIYADHFASNKGEPSAEAVNSILLARCAFDWYSVSACNFVSLVGWIANKAGLTKEPHDQYLKKVLPELRIHRHKMAAHYSRHSPKNDSYALQVASTMLFSLPWVNGHFVANAMKVAVRRQGVSSDSSELVPWSLVEVHDRLRSRYATSKHPERGQPESSGS